MHEDSRLTSEALTWPINKEIRYYLHFQDGKWHLPREVPGHCDLQSSSASAASSWAQTGTRRQSVDVSLVTYPERGSRGKQEARPKAGTGEKACKTAVPTSYSGDSYHSFRQANISSLNKVKGTIKLPVQRVSWRPRHGLGKSANNYPDPFLLFLLFGKALGFCDRARIVFLINWYKEVTSNTGGTLPLAFYPMS